MWEKTSQISRLRTYGVGEVLTLILVSVFSVLAEAAGEGFRMVVLVSFFSVFSEGGLVTVVSFCSQAASSAMPASRPMYFFIQMDRSRQRIQLSVFKESALASSPQDS
jgi:hypothetical protein